jgi:hypothetical protein
MKPYVVLVGNIAIIVIPGQGDDMSLKDEPAFQDLEAIIKHIQENGHNSNPPAPGYQAPVQPEQTEYQQNPLGRGIDFFSSTPIAEQIERGRSS